jgi:hypothetical protein
MKFILKVLLLNFLFLLSSCNNSNKNDSDAKLNISPHDAITLEDKNFGAIKGVLVTEDPNERIGLILYLGQIITDTNGMYGGFLNPDEAPRAKYDELSGEFSFINIVPGDYSLIIHEVVLGGQAYMDESGNIVKISVEPGKITDLEKVQFNGY